MVVHPFTKAFSQLSAADHVKDFLVDMLNIDQIIIGYNHRFGKNRMASVEELQHYGAIYGFEVTQINAEELDNISISSTKIRTAIAMGDVVTAELVVAIAVVVAAAAAVAVNTLSARHCV